MSSASDSETTGRRPRAPGKVRWRRFALIFVPAIGTAGVLLALTANGALASSFSISGQQFEVSADSLVGTGFQQFATEDATVNGTLVPVAESEIGSATITNLCQSLSVGPLTLRITAGGSGSSPVTASSLIIDANQLSGTQADFSNIQIGQDASTLNAVPNVPVGTAGTFGQQASSVTIDGLEQTAYATSAGTFDLPGFSLSLSTSNNACF